MFCPKCGTENADGVKFCSKCGNAIGGAGQDAVLVAEPASNAEPSVEASIQSHSNAQGATVTTINVQTPQVNKNPLGVAGFVLALIGVFVSWIPIVGWVVWVLGLIFSFVGLFKQPKGMAIAGIIITFIDLILLLFVVASCAAVGGGIVGMM